MTLTQAPAQPDDNLIRQPFWWREADADLEAPRLLHLRIAWVGFIASLFALCAGCAIYFLQ
jgi:hypothetical protein